MKKDQTKVIRKIVKLLISCFNSGFYGSVTAKMEDGQIVRLVVEHSIKEPFEVEKVLDVDSQVAV